MRPLTTTPPLCAACGGSLPGAPARPGAAAPAPEYLLCPRCATLNLWPLPAAETNAAFETPEVTAQMAAFDDRRLPWLLQRLQLIQRHMPAGAPLTLLDVGCGAGRLLGAAAREGWQVAGLELSPGFAAEARRHVPSATITQGDILQAAPTRLGTFQAIIALDVIEHVLDPSAMLARLSAMLPPGGLLLIQTPNAGSLRARLHGPGWNMRIPAYHFHLFSPAGLRLLLGRHGFTVVHAHTASGTGDESGLRRTLAAAKAALLRPGSLGNAIVMLARKSELPPAGPATN